jgi:hypothetical protein
VDPAPVLTSSSTSWSVVSAQVAADLCVDSPTLINALAVPIWLIWACQLSLIHAGQSEQSDLLG